MNVRYLSRGLGAAAVCLLVLSPGPAAAGDIDPALAIKVRQAPPDASLRAIVMLRDQVDLETLDAQLIARHATRQERHRVVVEALREMARAHQPELQAHLEREKARGQIQDYKGLWIQNMYLVSARPAAIEALAQRFDIGTVYDSPKIELIQDVSRRPAPSPLVGVEPGLTMIRADSLWRAGITGAGRIVCNLDTGVFGGHTALGPRWRGNQPGVTPQEAWFDPYNGTLVPSDEDGHGTHTMGTMCGRNSATGDTVGVSPDAQWIAANVFEGSQTNDAAFFGAFQWAIDPDGNPATVDDAPDVLSNSWGSVDPSCDQSYWRVIDANEVAGVAVVFAAGNLGPGVKTVTSPATRIATPVNTMAVGAVDAAQNIASFSSRGPSWCDGVTIKPEVVAMGVNVRSTWRTGGYAFLSGTSMSCPHVAGAIALLRQFAPNATVEDIKMALYTSAVDRGTPGEDNSYGRGRIDCVNAAQALLPIGTDPYIAMGGAVVQDGGNGLPDPGETFDLVVYLRNFGNAATGVSATLTSADPYVTILDGAATFGDIAQDTTGNNGGNPFQVSLSIDAPGARNLDFDLDATANGGAYTTSLFFSLVTPFNLTMGDHDIGNVRFSVSDGGRFGFNDLNLTDGNGFIFPKVGGLQLLFEGALLAGSDASHVSHSARSTPAGPVATDWQVRPGGTLVISTPGSISDQDGNSVYSDLGAPTPMDLEVSQRSFAFSASPDNDYVIVELGVTNRDQSTTWNNLYFGMYFDWDIGVGNEIFQNTGALDRPRDLGYMYKPASSRAFAGINVLTDPGIAGYEVINNQDGSYQFTRADFWSSLSGGFVDTLRTNGDYSFVISTGPFSLSPGESTTVAFGVVGGTNLSDLRANADSAKSKYREIRPIQSFVIEATPDSVGVARCDTLVQDIAVTNNTESVRRIRASFAARLPNGHIRHLLGPIPRGGVNVGAHATAQGTLALPVPCAAPLISVDFLSILLDYATGDTLDTDETRVTVTTSGAGAMALSPHGEGDAEAFVEALSDPSAWRFSGWLSGGSGALAGVGPSGDLPRALALHPNYPNPAGPTTMISFAVPSGTAPNGAEVSGNGTTPARLRIYTLRGELVRTLLNGPVGTGPHAVPWDGRTDSGAAAPAGIYLYRLEVGDKVLSRKLTLAR